MPKCLACESELNGLLKCPGNTTAGRPRYCILDMLHPAMVSPNWNEVVMVLPTRLFSAYRLEKELAEKEREKEIAEKEREWQRWKRGGEYRRQR